ncbi:site-specific integrase [Candidatus Synechococcus calcipolaris G9]|uniref:Site-specific integrase n=1 Tax=Candidatus Synechococcus calcipolaris G9 TaxID=1497997 RepID=A0ABT6F2L4_9SYNE|nr:site-specific integrase [Candidatus Synechococcus calcipolaris]MDG2992110.1 site-specific integrase [Candidatus Synechococcus calcipolaris G9]
MAKTATKAKKGSVTLKNSNGRLQLVFSYPILAPNGETVRKRFYLSTGFEDTPINRQRAGVIAATIQRDIDYAELDTTLERYKPASLAAGGVSPESMGLLALWQKYVDFKAPQVAPHTLLKDFCQVQRAIERLPSDSLGEAASIRDGLLGNMPVNSAKRVLTQIKACCKWAIAEKLISENPFAEMKITLPKGSGSPVIEPFTMEERDRILEAFRVHRYYSHYHPLVKFLFSTGCRPGEALALQWRHVQDEQILFEQRLSMTENGLQVIPGLKTQRRRTFPLNQELKAFLADLRESCQGNPEDYLFLAPGGGFLDSHNFCNRGWKTILSECGSGYRKLYQTRHSFITWLCEANVNTLAVSRWCGTSVAMIERHYAASNLNTIPPSL